MKVAVAGVCGKMGKVIAKLVYEDKDLELAAVSESPQSNCVGKKLKDVMDIDLDLEIKDSLKEQNFDVLIDFTTPEATIDHLYLCSQKRKPAVIGTTGLSKDQQKILKEIAKSIPIVYSPNMSVGVNLLFKLAPHIASVLGNDYDIEIVEIHHRFKKDAPSGTAVRLAENIAEALGRDIEKVGIFGRKGLIGERKQEEIGIFAVRAGDVVGEHTVIFATLGERIEITHRAHSRETFARGAIRAAKWIYGKPEGLYTMWDVLGL